MFQNNHEFISQFEKKISQFTGSPYVILTDSCTNAIFLSLYYVKQNYYINSKNHFITIPKNTYISIPQAIYNVGFEPVFENIKWKEHYKLGDLPIYDCAVGFKSNMYKQKTFMCLSFQQKKTLNIGKGGAILTDNKEAYEILKRLSWDGRDASLSVEQDKKILKYAFHMNMTPEQAAQGILLFNQLTTDKIQQGLKSYKDYPDISKIY